MAASLSGRVVTALLRLGGIIAGVLVLAYPVLAGAQVVPPTTVASSTTSTASTTSTTPPASNTVQASTTVPASTTVAPGTTTTFPSATTSTLPQTTTSTTGPPTTRSSSPRTTTSALPGPTAPSPGTTTPTTTFPTTATTTSALGTTTTTAPPSASVQQLAGEPPTVELSAFPEAGTAPLTVEFDAFAFANAPDATLQSYRLEFDDGSPPMTGAWPPPQLITHTYTTPGLYDPVLTVVDSAGNQGTAGQLIIVTAAHAVLTAQPDTGTVPLEVVFDTTGTTAGPNATIHEYSIGFGDGESLSGEGPPPTTVRHVYTDPCFCVAVLYIVTSRNESAQDSEQVTVGRPPPRAQLTASPTSGPAPLNVTFTPSATTDPGVTVDSYTLNFGDGSPPVSGQGPPPSSVPHTYESSGVYAATLVVEGSRCDPDLDIELPPGEFISLATPNLLAAQQVFPCSGSASVVITVEPTVGVRKGASPPSRPEPGGQFTFTVSVVNTSNEPVTLVELRDDVYGALAGRGTCAAGGSIAPGGVYTCSFSGSFEGDADDSETDTVTATVRDDEGVTGSGTASATVRIADALPSVVVDKTATPSSRPEPGGDFIFTVRVTNPGGETVRISSLVDDAHGDLAGRGNCGVGVDILPSGTYTCSFTVSVVGEPGPRADAVTVTVVDDEGSTATASDTATVEITGVAPVVAVSKTPSPLTRPEPGGAFTFTVVVANRSAEPVTLTVLTDDIYGDLSGRGTCTVGAVLSASGGTYACSFSESFLDDAGASLTDTVTATVVDNDGVPGTGSASATVRITDVRPSLTVDKTASPASVPEPGGPTTFSVVVTNTSFEPVTLTALADDVYGDLNGRGTCAIGIVLAPGGRYACSFVASVFGDAGTGQSDTVTATVVDDDGTAATAAAMGTVGIVDVRPAVTVTKGASPLSRPEPGGPFTFTVVVTNSSFEPVTLTTLTDDVYGDLNGGGTCETGIVLAAASGTYTCSFTGDFIGNAGAAQTDVVSAGVVDNDGSPASATASATVTIGDVAPAVTLDTTVTPASRPEPGGDFGFTVTVTNTGLETTTVSSLTDSVYGDLNGRGTCAVGATLAPSGVYTCTFTGPFLAEPGATQTNIVTVTVLDDDSMMASAVDVTTIVVTDVFPSITLTKTAGPPSRPEPGGPFTFAVAVRNTSPEPVTLTTLLDDVYGDLNGRGTCATGVVLAASTGTYTCSFTGDFIGNAGASQSDTVRATVVDNDRSTASASATATVRLTDVRPTVTIDKNVTPSSIAEPGGPSTVTVTVTNTSVEPVTLTTLTDDVHGDLNGRGTCAVGVRLAPVGGSYACSFPTNFFGDAGASQTDTVTATVVDDEGGTASATDSATVRLTDVPPSVRVEKVPLNPTLPAPGGAFAFSVVVTNTSFEPVRLVSLTDDPPALGTCASGVTIAPNGGTYSCGLVRNFSGPAGASQTDRVTVMVVDNDGSRAVATADATVRITAAPPPGGGSTTTSTTTTSTTTTSTTTTQPPTVTVPPTSTTATTTAPTTSTPPLVNTVPTRPPSTLAPVVTTVPVATTAAPVATTAAPVATTAAPVATTAAPITATAAPVATTAAPITATAAPVATVAPVTTTTLPPSTTTTVARTTATTTPPPFLPPPGGANLDAVNPEGERSGPPGVGLDVSGGGYLGCSKVYVFFDGVRIGTVKPDAAGVIGVGGLSVPGDADPGEHRVTSSCSSSGRPVRASALFQVTDSDLHRTAFVTALAQPRHVSTDLERLFTSAAVAVAVLLLLAFPYELFNSTMEENYDEIRGWFRLPPRVVDAASGVSGGVAFFVLTGLAAILVGFLSPEFGLNMTSLALVLGFSVALLVMALAFGLPAAMGIHRRTGEWGRLTFLPGSLLVSLVLVLLSRLLDFQPGYFYGALAGLAFRAALSKETKGRLTAANWIFSLALSVGAWIARVPVSEAAAMPDASLWWIAVEACLALIFLWGVEGLAVAMLPMRFLDGRKIIDWSRAVWGVLFFLGLFATIHVLLSPESGYVGHTTNEVTIAVMVLFAIFGALSVAFWAYFRYRPDRWRPKVRV